MMRMKVQEIYIRIIVLFFILLLFFSAKIFSKPLWLKKNIYVEYVIPRGEKSDGFIAYKVNAKIIYVGKGSFKYVNGTFVGNWSKTPKPGYKRTVFHRLIGDELINATYSWRVLDVSGGLAKIDVKFCAVIRNTTTNVISTLVRNATLYINVDNGDVYTLDGKYIGRISFCFTDIMKSLSRVITYKDSSIQINGTVNDYPWSISTPVGAFKCWYIISDMHPVYLLSGLNLYVDKVSGLLIAVGGTDYYDAILNYMNISSIVFPYTKGIIYKMILNKVQGIELTTGKQGLDPRMIILFIGLASILGGILIIIWIKVFKRRYG